MAHESVPIPTSPVEQVRPNAPEASGRRQGSGGNGGVVRSSLELVFSYSRSQQRFYHGLPSAPSFVDYQWDAGSDAEFSRPPSEFGDTEAGESNYADESADEHATDNESHDESFFPGDPVPRPTEPLATVKEGSEGNGSDGSGSASQSRSATACPTPTPLALSSNKPGNLMSFFGSTPPLATSVGASSNNSGGSQATPRQPVRKLSEVEGGSGMPTRGYGGVGKDRENYPRAGGAVFSSETSDTNDSGFVSRTRRTSRQINHYASESTPLLPDRSPSLTKRTWGPGRLTQQKPRRASIVSQRRRSLAKTPVHQGQSTDGQALFNAVAVLVGIGLLSMPLAFSYAGWIWGTFLVIAMTWITCHTAKLLARIMLADPSLAGYTDIGRKAFGGWAGSAINVLFCLELFTFGVAMVVLFGDSLNVVLPQFTAEQYMIMGFFAILPTTFMPLSLLSIPSIFSTLATALLVGIIVFDGFYKTKAPGSILDPMPTHWGPELKNMNWLGGVGLTLAGFGGHSVFPSIAKDMKNPGSIDRVFNIAFCTAGAISFISGAAGYLMIGDIVSDEITKDMMNPIYGYPRILNICAVWMIVINPLTKYGLCSRPLNVAIEGFLGLAPTLVESNPEHSAPPVVAAPPPPVTSRQRRMSTALTSAISVGLSIAGASDYLDDEEEPYEEAIQSKAAVMASYQQAASEDPEYLARESRKGTLRIISRSVITALATATAILLPGFEKVMAFIGSFSAFLICIILPLGFYLRIGPSLASEHNTPATISGIWRTIHTVLLVISVILMIMGTVWSFLPFTGHFPDSV